MNYIFSEFQKRVDKFSDTVYYEPMVEKEIVDFEKKIGKCLNSVYREFLSTFGLVQDILDNINTSQESILEDVDYLKDKLPDYFPIFVDVDEVDTIYLISTLNLDSDKVYKVTDYNGNLGEIKSFKTLTELLSISIKESENKESERCPNSEKVNCFEYSFESKSYNDFIKMFKTEGLKQLSEWYPKYYPDNVFGDEVAEFSFKGRSFHMERNKNKTEYRFEFDEPILTKKEETITYNMDILLNIQRINHKKEVTKLIET